MRNISEWQKVNKINKIIIIIYYYLMRETVITYDSVIYIIKPRTNQLLIHVQKQIKKVELICISFIR